MHATATTASPTASAPGLTASGLACRRGERLLFSGLDLSVAPGQVLWVRGINGRGKTSLLRLLTGLSSPYDGEIHHGTRTLRIAGADFRRRLVYIAHGNGLKDDLTVSESLGFLARIHGLPSSADELDDALRTFGMVSRRHAPVRTLSQGQRRRVALARLALDLASAPDSHSAERSAPSLWILDEPYDALDTDGITTLDRLLSAHARRGGSVVLTSHLPLTLDDPVPTVLNLDDHTPVPTAGPRRDRAFATA